MTWRAQIAGLRFRLAAMACRESVSSIGYATPRPAFNVVSDGLPLQPPPKGLPDLTARALTLHNRNPKAVAVYLAKHAELRRAICLDDAQ